MSPEVSYLEKRLQKLEDKDALATLLNRYCKTADDREWDQYASCFTHDGVMEYEGWGPVVGREKISKVASEAENRFEGLQHTFTNYQFEVNDNDEALGTSYLWFAATMNCKKPEENYAFGGAYRWNFKRTENGWKIQRMHLRKLWSKGEDTEKRWTD